MSNSKVNKEKKPLKDMDLIDDFLFSEVMSDKEKGKEVCRLILSRVLKREVGEIDFTPERIVPGISERNHGIRMDAYITEFTEEPDIKKDKIKIFDLEPDKRSGKKNGLPRRSRYYADLIDTQLLGTGVDYEDLPELVTIFILSYDPFGMGDMIYEVGSIIKTHPEVSYNDGIQRVFLYVDGKLPENAGEDERKLRDLLKYISRSVEENVKDKELRKLDDIVKSIKIKPEVGIRYMKSWEWEKEIREEGREEERKNTVAERRRADKAEARVKELEGMLAGFKKTGMNQEG